MSTNHDDQGLIEACRAGKTEAFGNLVRRYQDQLYPTALHLSGCAEGACELLQESFVRAFETLDRLPSTGSFPAWVYRIAIHLTIDRHRPWPSEHNDRIRLALHTLGPPERAVVVMKDLDGLSYETIAEVLGEPTETVRRRLHNARTALVEQLGDAVERRAVRETTSGQT